MAGHPGADDHPDGGGRHGEAGRRSTGDRRGGAGHRAADGPRGPDGPRAAGRPSDRASPMDGPRGARDPRGALCSRRDHGRHHADGHRRARESRSATGPARRGIRDRRNAGDGGTTRHRDPRGSRRSHGSRPRWAGRDASAQSPGRLPPSGGDPAVRAADRRGPMRPRHVLAHHRPAGAMATSWSARRAAGRPGARRRDRGRPCCCCAQPPWTVRLFVSRYDFVIQKPK